VRYPRDELFRRMPPQIRTVFEIVRRLDVYEKPNYDTLIALLVDAMTENGCTWDDPLDWERLSPGRLRKITPIDMTLPEGEVPDVPDVLPPDVPEFAPFDSMDSSVEAIIQGQSCFMRCMSGACFL